MAFPKMNQKAFNLFTALVSFLLIMLTVLLVNSMIQTERKASETIASVESRSDLEAVAQMARADAMQVFNYALRKRIEDWLTHPSGGELILELQDRSWSEIQREFAESKFGGAQSEAFATFTANALIGIFYEEAHFGNYLISLEGRETLKEGLQNAVLQSLDDFFTVIGCDGGDPKNCPKGTFYVNLHLDRLTQGEYEKLPKLHVVDKATGEELREVILPRTTFRIYVPLRFFKAIAEARALTHFPLDQINKAPDKGLFSPRVHNTIEEIALGMCDKGYCVPRSNPFTPPALSSSGSKLFGQDSFCPGDTDAANWADGLNMPIECPYEWCQVGGVPATYNANNNDDSESMITAVKAITAAKICEVVEKAREEGFIDVAEDEGLQDVPGGDGFYLLGEECGGAAFKVEVGVEARGSKNVESEKGKGSESSGWSGSYDADNCSRQNDFSTRKLGLYSDGSDVMHPVLSLGELPCPNGSLGAKQSYCAEVKYLKVTLAFKEENPTYTVTKPGTSGSYPKVYKISLRDNTYVPFTANWDQGSLGSDCLYSGVPTQTGCSVERGQGWYCISKFEWETDGYLSTPGKGGKVDKGCVPA